MSTTAVLGMAVGQRPGAAGHAELAVAWMSGLRALGLEPLLVDRMDEPGVGDIRRGVGWVASVMAEAGFARGWSVLLPDGEWAGRSRREVAAHSRGGLVVDVMGYLDGHLEDAACRAYLDVDPGFRQVWAELGLHAAPTGYDSYLSVGLAAASRSWRAPNDGLPWQPLPPPVALHRWQVAPGAGRSVTTVGTWRGPYAALELGGVRLGLRAHAMRAFADLPRMVRAPFDVVLDIDPADATDENLLARSGWRVRPPAHVASPERYRRFIAGSVAEICIAKEVYSRLATGWFSDRSACYLAAGRPVVMTDTGFGDSLPVGAGLHVVDAPAAAAAALNAILVRRSSERDAARSIAEEHLDARRVVARAVEIMLGAATCR